MTTAATYEDVGIALGRPITDTAEQQQINYWLTGIELTIKARYRDLSQLDQAALKYVETEAVAAKVRRHGTRESSITVSVDDGSVTRRYDTPATAEDITDEWWNLLTPAVEAASFTVSPYGTRQQPLVDGCWP